MKPDIDINTLCNCIRQAVYCLTTGKNSSAVLDNEKIFFYLLGKPKPKLRQRDVYNILESVKMCFSNGILTQNFCFTKMIVVMETYMNANNLTEKKLRGEYNGR